MATYFDSKEYQFKDLQVVVAGEPLAELKELKYGLKRDKEYNYGRGDKPNSIQHGNLEGSGNIKLTQSALERLVAKAPNGDITLLQFNIVAAYAPELGDKQSVDIIQMAEVTEWAKGMAQGDKLAEIDLPIMFLDVKQNA